MRAITPINNHGAIQLKWCYQGHRYTIHPLPGAHYSNPGDLERVRDVATQIALDIRRGLFDPSLDRYRPVATVPPVTPEKPIGPVDLLGLWDAWVETLGLSEETRACHYECVRRMIVRTRPEPRGADTAWFIEAIGGLAASTSNKRLQCLRKCLDYGMTEGLVTENPYRAIKARPVRVVPVKPFSTSEVERILEGFRAHRPSYVPFVAFLFMTGCRTSEAIGIQWKRIDLGRSEVTIADSLPRSSVTGKPRRKGTKTGSVTVLDMSDDLRALLVSLEPGAPDDLVFKSPDGLTIHRHTFLGVWSRVLSAQGIAYRKPYTTRHTMASHAIDQGIPLTGVAYILGHRDTTQVMQTYGHMVNRPKLPRVLPP
jgi:integrase